MPEVNSASQSTAAVAAELYHAHRLAICRRTDRMFAGLMMIQWLFGIIVATIVSPRTWSGTASSVHPHVWAAILLGGAISVLPVYLGIFRPGQTITRYVISVAQMLTSALLIHLTGGRIETHFHVFGSLAFLAFYGDWKVLIPATIIVAADHLLRGLYFPQSVYGVLAASPWRWLEHAGWVAFEDIFLIASCRRSDMEARQICERAADLRAAKEAAEAANRAKSEFLANMSHEIRTPINGVIGVTDLLMRRELSPQQLRYAEVIKSSADSLLALINDVLDFSKIEAGKLELDLAEFEVRRLVEDVVEMLAPKASEKRLEFGCDIHPDVRGCFRGDPDRLRQILVNLANNAIKFTQRGEVIIRVALAGRTAEQSTLKFSVQDTGIGIPADRRDRLFKSFSQVDASMSRKYGGTGLGLAIARQLVELMGGQIGCDSVPGEGSTFHFTVTLAQASPSSAPAAAPRLDLRGLRVLVVDDNATYRDILANQLLSWGFDVALAEDAEVALRELVAAQQQHKPFRIAIVDMILPGKSGPELAAIVRQDSALARTAMIMVTSADSGFDPGEMREIGFSACLTKPIRQSHLFDAIVESMTPASRSSEQTEAPRVREAGGNRARILLAEDNTVNQMVASELLKDAGYLCDIVADGRGAVEAAAHDAYAIILMDCQMPEMNGFDATREIRASEARNGKTRVPIIALTANAVQGDRERCLETGMDDYVTKPIDPDLLLKTIERHLAEQSPHVIGASKPAPEAQTTAGSATIPTSASSGMPPVDTSSLLRRCRGKASLVEQLLQKFESQALEQLRSLEEAASRNDREAIARISHAVKGAAANLSAESVRASAMTLEGSAAALGEDELLRGIERLAASVRECVAYIPSACVELEKLAAAGASEVK